MFTFKYAAVKIIVAIMVDNCRYMTIKCQYYLGQMTLHVDAEEKHQVPLLDAHYEIQGEHLYLFMYYCGSGSQYLAMPACEDSEATDSLLWYF